MSPRARAETGIMAAFLRLSGRRAGGRDRGIERVRGGHEMPCATIVNDGLCRRGLIFERSRRSDAASRRRRSSLYKDGDLIAVLTLDQSPSLRQIDPTG